MQDSRSVFEIHLDTFQSQEGQVTFHRECHIDRYGNKSPVSGWYAHCANKAMGRLKITIEEAFYSMLEDYVQCQKTISKNADEKIKRLSMFTREKS